MRVNIYAEEMTDRVEIVTKRTEAGDFTGLRFYLELPISIPTTGGYQVTHKGPFIHRPGDDDSSAVTFWGKHDFRKVLQRALYALDRHYEAARDHSRDQGAMVATHTGRDQQEEKTPIKR